MASKSKKRRRVLGASCILAALIIAGSSFAWFTSKDEVTNRLSANADYDVSIVESYAPPKNWLPGQEINKDVYAVNTGNIAAFVNEDVSGVMNVTYEVASDTFVQTSAVKLDDTEIAETAIDGVTAKEVGAFLAFTTSSAPTGYLVSSRTEDDLSGRFVPTEEGVYIFRRSIDVGTDGIETYTYDGYYFDGTNYYKIKIDSTTVKPDTEGELSAATYKYVLDLKETAKPVGLYYDADNTRLVATYAIDPAASMPYDAEAIAARKAVDLANATAAQTTANTNYNNAKTAMDRVNALINARNTVVDEAKNLNNLITTSADKKTAMDNADTTVNDKVDAITVPTFPASAVQDDTAYTGAIKASVDKYNSLIDTVKDTDLEALTSALTDIKNVTSGTKVSDAQKTEAATKLSTLKTNALALYQAYAEIKDAGAAYDTDGTIKQALEDFLDDVNALDLTELNNAITAYNNAVDNNTTAAGAVDATAYGTALNGYREALNAVPNGVTTTPYQVANTTTYSDNETGKAAVKANAELSPYPMQNVTADNFSYTVSPDTKTVAQWKAISDAADARVAEITARAGDYSPTSGNIEIYINLDPSFASYWQIEDGVKTKAVAPADQETQEMVSFYLKHILDEGKTSEKLIDSVTLSPDTQNVFKSFDFDLNVALDSAQITYADDQVTVTSEAVQAPAFGMTANVDPNNKDVSWS